MGRDDFLVTPSNAAAVALVEQWPHWPAHAAVIIGGAASGKSHLGQVWQSISAAAVLCAAELTTELVPHVLRNGAVLLEDLNVGDLQETALFHLLNSAREHGGQVLITSAVWPVTSVHLPDLVSRLAALPLAHILPPDDALLRGVLVKQFNDRQIAVDEALVSYLVTRMPRSLEMARQLVSRIDEEALEQGAEITRAFAAKVLNSFENPDFL